MNTSSINAGPNQRGALISARDKQQQNLLFFEEPSIHMSEIQLNSHSNSQLSGHVRGDGAGVAAVEDFSNRDASNNSDFIIPELIV
jgi:hypothetical protein